MTSSSELRRLWAPWYGEEAKKNKSATVVFPGQGRVWELLVADRARDAFIHMARIMDQQQYLFRESAGGTWVVRDIEPGVPSLHSYGIAIDINPSKNPFGTCTTDMPAAFTDAVKALRTVNGKQVFTWAGDWRPCSVCDPMHFQIDCSPDDLKTGIQNGDDDMPSIEEIRAVIREELDRRQDGRLGPVNKAFGIVEGVWGYRGNLSAPSTTETSWQRLIGTDQNVEDIEAIVKEEDV